MKKTKLHNDYMCVEGLGSSMHVLWLVVQSLWAPLGPRLVDSVGFLVVSLTPLAPSSPSSARFPGLCLMFGCGSLHLFPSVAG